MTDLTTRTGLPDALRVLVAEYPRETWESHPNFTELTRFWLDRHMMFRDLLGRLSDGAERYLDGKTDAQRHAHETQRYVGFLLNQLHGHHQIEDMHYFPQLQGLDPRVEAAFGILDRDHKDLDGHIQGMADRTNAYLQRWQAADAKARAGELRDGLRDFERFIHRHLTDEEEIVVPVILHHAPDMH